MEKIKMFFMCYLMGNHKWTCKASKGIQPVKNERYKDYARMYCDRCGKESKLNSRLN